MRVPRHIVDRRHEQLRDLIRTDGFMPVSEICRRMGVSVATARRDLAAIAAGGHITRTHGGALADYNASFASHGERATRARTAKGRIADAALKLLPAKGKIFLDAGTTVCALARAMLKHRGFDGLMVATNSLPVASVLGGMPGIDLHVLGGIFLHRQSALLGEEAIDALGGWHFDLAFLGGEGMDASGLTNSHEEIASFQRAVLHHTGNAWFLLDATKIGRSTPHVIVGWKEGLGLVTDASEKQLSSAGITLPRSHLIALK